MTTNEVITILEEIELIDDSIYQYNEKYLEALNMAIQALEQTRWIPISERLPEEFESVLVCYKSQGGIAQCVTERLVNMNGSNLWSAMYGREPIAWMPLPEPYKADKEKKNDKI